MRRCLAILLLALLPLQFSWAAVAAYCGHEVGRHAEHLGHHEHQHQHQQQHPQQHTDLTLVHQADLADPDTAPADPEPTASFHIDCGHCHGTVASLPTAVGAMSPLVRASHTVTPADGILRTHAPSPPERPQWQPLA